MILRTQELLLRDEPYQFEEKELKLSAADKTHVDTPPNIGTTSETVSVNASTMPADSSVVQDTVEEKQVPDLPLNGRSLQSSAQQTASVSAGSPNAISGGERPDDRRPSKFLPTKPELLNPTGPPPFRSRGGERNGAYVLHCVASCSSSRISRQNL